MFEFLTTDCTSVVDKLTIQTKTKDAEKYKNEKEYQLKKIGWRGVLAMISPPTSTTTTRFCSYTILTNTFLLYFLILLSLLLLFL